MSVRKKLIYGWEYQGELVYIGSTWEDTNRQNKFDRLQWNMIDFCTGVLTSEGISILPEDLETLSFEDKWRHYRSVVKEYMPKFINVVILESNVSEKKYVKREEHWISKIGINNLLNVEERAIYKPCQYGKMPLELFDNKCLFTIKDLKDKCKLFNLVLTHYVNKSINKYKNNDPIRTVKQFKAKCKKCGNVIKASGSNWFYREIKSPCTVCALKVERKVNGRKAILELTQRGFKPQFKPDEYLNSQTKVKVECPNCNESFKATVSSIKINNMTKCSLCSVKKSAEERSNGIGYLLEVAEERGVKLLSKEYSTINELYKWECPCGNSFERRPNDLRKGKWALCEKCISIERAKLYKKTPQKTSVSIIDANGVTYISKSAAARAHNISVTSVTRHCDCGSFQKGEWVPVRNPQFKYVS